MLRERLDITQGGVPGLGSLGSRGKPPGFLGFHTHVLGFCTLYLSHPSFPGSVVALESASCARTLSMLQNIADPLLLCLEFPSAVA